jgi:hypothetical protein
MDIGVPFKHHGKVNMEPLAAAITAADESVWNEYVERQKSYEVH